MINIVLFGPPGAGKGTQALKIKGKFNLIHLSTGDIFRANISYGTELGLLARNYMDQGQLVPDEVTIRMLQSEVDKFPSAKGFIFDGFPRTIAQAQALDALLHRKRQIINMTLALEVDELELTRRIMERGKSSGRVDDQDEATVRTRVSEYNSKTAPLKKFYAGQGKLHSVIGVGSVEEIFEHLVEAIEMEMAEHEVKVKLEKVFEQAEIKKGKKSSPKGKAGLRDAFAGQTQEGRVRQDRKAKRKVGKSKR